MTAEREREALIRRAFAAMLQQWEEARDSVEAIAIIDRGVARLDAALYARAIGDAIKAVEGRVVNRPSDPLANAYDGAMNDALTRLRAMEGGT